MAICGNLSHHARPMHQTRHLVLMFHPAVQTTYFQILFYTSEQTGSACVCIEGSFDKNVLLSLCRLQKNGLLADPTEFFDLFSYLEVSIQNCLPLCARGHNFFISIFSIHMACAVFYGFGLLEIQNPNLDFF